MSRTIEDWIKILIIERKLDYSLVPYDPSTNPILMHWPAVSMFTKLEGGKNADEPNFPLCIRKFWQFKSWQFLLTCRLELSYSYAQYYDF